MGKRSVSVAERTLPHNLEAERSVLGAILVHNSAWDHAAERLRSSDFYRDAHARIWKAMQTLIDRKVAVDFTTLREELTRVGDIDEVGGAAYISSLSDGVPRATNVTYYAGIVREKAMLREVIDTANKVLASAYEAEDAPEDVLRKADRAFLELQRRKTSSRMRALKETTKGIFERLEWRAANRGKLVGVETGYPSINELTLGWRKKDMIILAARPSIGKTVFAMNTAVAAALAGSKVAIFSYEMRREQLEDRLLSSIAQVPFHRIEGGYLGERDYGPIANALGIIGNLPITIDDRAGQYVGEIRSTCRRLLAEDGLDLVVIDYVQLMPSENRRGTTRNEQLAEISRAIKEMADELDLPIILLSQLKRLDSRKSDPRPQLDDLRDCGSLEQDADEVNFLHRKNHKENGTTNFIREKARNGPTGSVNLTIDRDTVTFTDGGEDPPPEPPERRRRKGEQAPTEQPELPTPEDSDS
jgi:replicative DNA helicase